MIGTTHTRLVTSLATERARVLEHAVYESVRDVSALRAFMEIHVFAVWDFMSLLKALQRRLTCVEVPWVPPASRAAARLVNALVLAEETDEPTPGVPTSHFELYCHAMSEVGADRGPIDGFLAQIRAGATVREALAWDAVPAAARAFVTSTFDVIARGSTAAIASSFLIGREDLVPAMFRRLLPRVMREPGGAPSFLHYLERHVDLDESEHGPLAQSLLEEVIGSDPARFDEAVACARAALKAREGLWDGVLARTSRGERELPPGGFAKRASIERAEIV